MKPGAFIVMTTNEGTLYHNGTTGVIDDIYIDPYNSNRDYLRITINHSTITIYRKCYRDYELAVDDSGTIQKKIVGEYYQFPVRLAYAWTIHKSQGQTYEYMNCSPDTFAAGQLYVMLSRITDITGLYLTKPIARKNLICDPTVKIFYTNSNNPDYNPGLKLIPDTRAWLDLNDNQYNNRFEKSISDVQSTKDKKQRERTRKPKEYRPKENKSSGRPNRFPNGQRQMRVPLELDAAITKLIDDIYPKNCSGINMEKLQKFIDYVDSEY